MHDLPNPVQGASCHAVYFYRDLDEMGATVGRFLAEGLALDQSAIVLCRPETCERLETELGHLGIDVEAAKADGALVLVDAATFLDSILVAGRLDPTAATRGFRSMLDSVRRSSGDRTIRLFGETSDMLWRAGLHVAALELESFDLTSVSPRLTVVCGYGDHPLHEGTSDEDIRAFHSHLMLDTGELSALP